MPLQCGIIGLPNVGKSTLFNALVKNSVAQAENFPFTTIEPNRGLMIVPDRRLQQLALLSESKQTVPNTVMIVDIAGLVRGASQGQGLGNKFLAHIREVDALLHVIRCFKNDDITHVENSINPTRDAELIELELILADIDWLQRQQQRLQKKRSQLSEADLLLLQVSDDWLTWLNAGKGLRNFDCKNDVAVKNLLCKLPLLSTKPLLYIANVEENAVVTGNQFSAALADFANQNGALMILGSAQIEAELTELDSNQQQQFLESLGLAASGTARICQAAFKLLGQITFFTSGAKETRAWNLRNGASASEAAGTIHSDFQRGFIAAERIAFTDFISGGGTNGARRTGRLSLEGRDYLVKEGDVLHFLFNV